MVTSQRVTVYSLYIENRKMRHIVQDVYFVKYYSLIRESFKRKDISIFRGNLFTTLIITEVDITFNT